MKLGSIEITPEDISAAFSSLVEGKKRISVPKNKKDKIGIVIAIKTENHKEKDRLENDLISRIHEYLQSSGLANEFYIIKYGENLCQKISDIKTAGDYLKRSRGHFIVFGDLAERNFNNVNNYVFKLHGVVRHLPIPINHPERKKLEEDFTKSLPGRLFFPEDKEMFGFELTKDLIGYAIKLIIGSAALISGDSDISYKLIKEVYTELLSQDGSNPLIAELLKISKRRLIQTLDLKVGQHNNLYVLKRDDQIILNTKKFLEEQEKLGADDPGFVYGKAVLLYKENKVDEAIEFLKSMSYSCGKDPLYYYNLGFLLVYKGKIDDALDIYKKAYHGTLSRGTLNDIEIFITKEIERRPDLIQLLFFRGLINYKGKTDYILAKEDFTKFLELDTRENFKELIDLANKFLSKIDSSVGRPK